MDLLTSLDTFINTCFLFYPDLSNSSLHYDHRHGCRLRMRHPQRCPCLHGVLASVSVSSLSVRLCEVRMNWRETSLGLWNMEMNWASVRESVTEKDWWAEEFWATDLRLQRLLKWLKLGTVGVCILFLPLWVHHRHCHPEQRLWNRYAV